MEKINITIPDNLNANEEILAIAKHLGNNMLPTNKELISCSYELKHLETQITIKREPTEDTIVTRECSVCATIFEQGIGSKLWVNYGGKKKQRHYCSDECREVVLQIVGNGRASIKKGGLVGLKLWRN